MTGAISIVAVVNEIALGAFIASAIYAALCDAARYIIPNRASLAMLLAYVPHALAVPHVFLPGIITGFCVLIAGILLFALRLTGGGDVKFLAAASLWSGPALLPTLLLAVTLTGGLLACGALVWRGWRHAPAGLSHAFHEAAQTKIPYGIAIAAGALLIAARLHGAS